MVGSTYLREVYQARVEVLIPYLLKTGKITDYCKTYYGISNADETGLFFSLQSCKAITSGAERQICLITPLLDYA
jgi:hypothetical protein